MSAVEMSHARLVRLLALLRVKRERGHANEDTIQGMIIEMRALLASTDDKNHWDNRDVHTLIREMDDKVIEMEDIDKRFFMPRHMDDMHEGITWAYLELVKAKEVFSPCRNVIEAETVSTESVIVVKNAYLKLLREIERVYFERTVRTSSGRTVREP
jgi:hypothetical protein